MSSTPTLHAPERPEEKTGTDTFLPLTPALMGDPFTLFPFVRPMLRDEPSRSQVHFAIQYDSQYDDPADENTP